jgi:hypothetical protein
MMLTFPVFDLRAGGGLDYSWAAGLHLAGPQNLAYGRDITFTFGPLGWASIPIMFHPVTGTIAIWLRVPLLLGGSALNLYLWKRILPWWLATLVSVLTTWMLVSTMSTGGLTPLLAFMTIAGYGTNHLLTKNDPLRTRAVLAIGALSALALLSKFDTGVNSLIVGAAVIVLGAFRSQLTTDSVKAAAAQAAMLAASFATTVVAVWVACGQPLSWLGHWLRASMDIFTGYNSSMVASYGKQPDEVMAAIIVVAVVLLMLVRMATETPSRRRAVAITALFSSGVLALAAKQSFVRHDSGHVLRIANAASIIALVFVTSERWPGRSDRRPAMNGRSRRWLALGFAAITIGASALFTAGTDRNWTQSLVRPDHTVKQLRSMAVILSPSNRRNTISTQQRQIPPALGVPPEMLERMRNSSVHVEPWEASLAWALQSSHNVRWRPLPTFQSYSAYTATLDDANAAVYESDEKAPSFVIVERQSIDFRWHRWESPEAWVQLICHYRPVERTDKWQLMERRPDGSGCDEQARALGEIKAVLGGPLVTPAAPDDHLVTVRFDGLDPSPVKAVQELATRASTWHVLRPNEPGIRLLVGTAGQRHIIAFPACLRGQMGVIDTASVPLMSVSPVNREPEPTMRTVTAVYESIPYRCP